MSWGRPSSRCAKACSREALTASGWMIGVLPSSSASVKVATASRIASGLPRVSVTIRFRTAASTGTPVRSMSAAASAADSPRSSRVAQSRRWNPVAVAHSQQQQHSLAAKTAPGEQQRLARWRIEPVRIVHDDQDGRFLGGRRQEAERRRSHGEPVPRHGRPERQRTRQRGLLRCGNPAKQVQDRAQQLRKTRECQLRFRLKRTSTQHLEINRPRDGVFEQPRLPDARLAVDKQRRTLAAAGPGDQAIESRTLAFPADQHRSNRNQYVSRRSNLGKSPIARSPTTVLL